MPTGPAPQPLLRTKLHLPRPRDGAVRRDRLVERLDRAAWGALTLISAPPGFGKTSLVAEWLQRTGVSAAWLSLDPDDDEPARFWRYLAGALSSVDPSIGTGALELLGSGAPAPSRAVASVLVDATSGRSGPVVCVLDDFHCIASRAIHDGMRFLVAHAPPTLHLVITTRADPPWPLARLRAAGRLSEIRAADLRFDVDEIGRLMHSAGFDMDRRTVAAIEARTEGWAAGLQLAALSLRGRDDVDGFVHAFSGSHRFVLDYLTEEVLSRQTDETVSFLIRTSILDRLTGPLCDALTGETGGGARLQALASENLFTEPLDDERRWYRYHPLFADVLRSRLRAMSPATVPELHQRAALWFEEQGLPDEAIHHALEGGDAALAVRLIRASVSATFLVGSQQRVLRWLQRLPEDAIAHDADLALARAWGRFVVGELDGIEAALEVADVAIASETRPVKRLALTAQLDAMRAWIAYQLGDIEGCIALARDSLRRLPKGGLVARQTALAALSSGLVLVGALDEAGQVLAEVRAMSRRAHDRLTESLARALEGLIELLRGRPDRCRDACEEAIAIGTIAGESLPSVGIARVVLGEALRAHGDLGDAERMLVTGIALCEAALGMPEWVYEGQVTLARVALSLGERERAQALIEQADRLFEARIRTSGMMPLVQRALDYRARFATASGSAELVFGGRAVWIEPLNARETELLRLLAARRTNREIAEQLFLSVNTVKWHARNLYGKLGAKDRAEAVTRARELGIL